MKVPVFDLSRARERIAGELSERWKGLLDQTSFVGGTEVEQFENAFATYLGVEGCVGVANGTDALVLALRALGLEQDQEVIVPGFTFVATAASVVLAGGRPVFADVDPSTLNLDPESARAKVSPATVGIIGVHLYGRPFAVDRIAGLCEEHGLWLLEDAAQAHGASWQGHKAGGLGKLATWSFYPSKNLGCFGDGGAVSGDDPALLQRVRRLANHGREAQYHHVEVGTNSRLDALQAAVLNCRLKLLDSDNARRRQVAGQYRDELKGVGDLRLLDDPEDAVPVYHQLTVRTRHRDDLKKHLSQQGIGSAIHYPEPLHLQPAFESLCRPRPELPEAEAAGKEVLCLPMFPEIADAEVGLVCAAIREFFD